ncbi:MAG: two-component regulator propeller domain-containing protein, partial [Bacteroidota bacterium]
MLLFLLISLGVFGFAFSVQSQTPRPNLEVYTVADGLSQGYVHALFEDKDGYLWIGTGDGLNRFDGYQFKAWQPDPTDPFSLRGTVVVGICAAPQNRLWIGTSDGGLHLFDPATEHFTHVPLPPPPPGKNALIRDIASTKDGTLFVVAPDNRISTVSWDETLKDWAVRPLASPPSGPNKWRWRRSKLAAHPDKVCLQAEGGVHCFFRADSSLFYPFPYLNPPHPAQPAPIPRIRSFNLDRAGNLCLHTHSGLVVIDHQNPEQYRHFPVGHPAKAALEDQKGRHWMVVGDSVFCVTKGWTGEWESVAGLKDATGAMLEDRSRNIWVGSGGYGLYKCSRMAMPFKTVANGRVVYDFAVHASGKIIDRHNLQREVLQGYGVEKVGIWDQILTVENDQENAVWLVRHVWEKDRGRQILMRYDWEKHQVTKYESWESKVNTSCAALRVGQGQNAAIWIANASELIRYRPQTGTAERFPHHFSLPYSNTSPNVATLHQMPDGPLLIGTGHGLLVFDRSARSFSRPSWKIGLHESDTLQKPPALLSISPDPQHPESRVWLGTRAAGLFRFDLDSGQFTAFTRKNGLPNNTIYSILPGQGPELWLSTNNGLVRMRTDSIAFQHFDMHLGMPWDEFNTHAAFRSSDGHLYFGGLNGVVGFNPAEIRPNRTLPNIRIHSLQVNNRPFQTD